MIFIVEFVLAGIDITAAIRRYLFTPSLRVYVDPVLLGPITD